MQIHKEGFHTITWMFILAGLTTTLLWHYLDNTLISALISLPIWAGWVFILRFFRNPNRPVIENNNDLLAPADGLIVEVREHNETEFFNKQVTKISIFMSGYDIHVNWIPISGQVTYFKYHPGKKLFARHPKSSEENERTTLAIENSADKSVLVKQIAGLMARRVVAYIKAGDEVKQGQEMGFIKFGSRVELFLPDGFQVMVKPGQRVIGTKTRLAIWA
ncbi:MAG: phosphatidylserine decarboxylase family protein [Bacteroidetes bacterium]|jgi:phosphatidylserine decarboxylase|nr:phosphatidylserine decarboxylase family protein [Bacteroidota bacterium]MBT4400199.1 phosphatidylserine decarboxylase family protein [Bacteroidota bacterium]MBT4408768.1 phosphatidylserine decarboxylase family protein [Bacteroidota bacterium]MBT5426157.1 phosphatidylserine decarboxylase family protein [Bacteroidota bacterium]MBT7094922.1 phosphatidylserine decarboxylase family protein [Bacteroidota bacterium]